MGITWRTAMPLLSTLAALVIIVHSAEENLDRPHRYDLKPRVMDTKFSDNEQPWRVVRSHPVERHQEPQESWYESNDEPPARRRVPRKRKRRPPASEKRRNHETDDENDEEPTRPRKKLKPNRRLVGNNSEETLRALRRKGQRRNRPSLETWPELSEFGAYPRQKKLLEAANKQLEDEEEEPLDISYYRPAFQDPGDDREIRVHDRKPAPDGRFVVNEEIRKRYQDPEVGDKSLSEFSMEVMGPLQTKGEIDPNDYRVFKDKLNEKSTEVFTAKDKGKDNLLSLKLDKYFAFKSNFVSSSLLKRSEKYYKPKYTLKELIEGIKSQDKMDDSVDYRDVLYHSSVPDIHQKFREKILPLLTANGKSISFLEEETLREQGPIDPHTLKNILKRSNGTSLSEILQQHNLTLADLLNGKENAIAVLKSESEKSLQNVDINTSKDEKLVDGELNVSKDVSEEVTTTVSVNNVELGPLSEHETSATDFNTRLNRSKKKTIVNKDFQLDNTNINQTIESTIQSTADVKEDLPIKKDIITDGLTTTDEASTEITTSTTETPKIQQRTSGMMLARRPMPGTIRRKLRMRPMVNNTFKSQINRDLMALSARRYVHHNRRNVTKAKAKEWREMIPLMPNINISENIKNTQNKSITTTSLPEETTTTIDLDEPNETTISEEPVTNVTDNENIDVNNETTTIAIEILATELDINVTEKSIVNRPPVNQSGLRRQSFNNRLKKKRMKQRTSTTEAPQDDIMKNLLELGDLVSSSEFIARTQIPKATSPDDHTETATELEDFLTTQAVTKSSVRSTRPASTRKHIKSTAVTKSPVLSSTEENAKIEIEEILNDTRTSAKLSKILMERNMTLHELFEHRERGSSHVHLADIFHNTSREPNPPEPFLSKSLIEPISKETYPLRALLDANSHDPTTKATTIDPIFTNHINIPVIMDFGNNVNENAENMGIMSLFNNFTKNAVSTNDETSVIQKDSKGIPYKSTVTAVNATDDDNEATRESRMLDEDEDMISWNDIFSMIRKNHKNETNDLEKITNEISAAGIHKKITLEEDADGDGLIVLEDLQHLKELGSNTASSSEEKIEFNTLESSEVLETGILNKNSNSAKSVTVATASIVGLAMVLFLLTYAALKWRQQRTVSHKSAFCDERIPSPVFENRKGAKNCSSRSISPMLPTSNIYTMNTLDSQNGKDSPEYMWDTLRKPFQ